MNDESFDTDPNYGDDYPFFQGSLLSNCCGANVLGEIDQYNCGICSDCHEHAVFENEEE